MKKSLLVLISLFSITSQAQTNTYPDACLAFENIVKEYINTNPNSKFVEHMKENGVEKFAVIFKPIHDEWENGDKNTREQLPAKCEYAAKMFKEMIKNIDQETKTTN